MYPSRHFLNLIPLNLPNKAERVNDELYTTSQTSAKLELIDNAGNRMIDLALAPTTQRAENDYLGLVEYGLVEMAKFGITSACDARTYWKRNHHQTWKRFEDECKLTARINLGLWCYPSDDDSEQINMLNSLYSNDANSRLKINQIKLYSDEIIHNTTAAMHEDYLIERIPRGSASRVSYRWS